MTPRLSPKATSPPALSSLGISWSVTCFSRTGSSCRKRASASSDSSLGPPRRLAPPSAVALLSTDVVRGEQSRIVCARVDRSRYARTPSGARAAIRDSCKRKAAIIDATNTYRQSKGLATLSESEDASREGQAYANYLAEKTKGGHSAGGRDPVQRLRAGGVKVLQVPRGQLARVVDEACARLSRRCDGCSHALLEEIAGT